MGSKDLGRKLGDEWAVNSSLRGVVDITTMIVTITAILSGRGFDWQLKGSARAFRWQYSLHTILQ